MRLDVLFITHRPKKPRVGLRAAPSVWLAVALLLAGCAPSPPPAAIVPAAYVTPVSLRTSQAERRLTATVVSRLESEVAFRVGGKVVTRLAELGQEVRVGQPLARLDGNDLGLALEVAAEQLRAAEVDAQQAASDAARFARLASEGSLPGADHERQQARADAASARLAQARRQLDLARNRRNYTTLTAPFDGVVTAVRAEPGQVVAEGQPVFAIARAQGIELAVDVQESMAASLSKQRATAVDPDGVALPLRLRELAPSASAVSRTFRARYALAVAPPPAWRLGMTTELRIAGTTGEPTGEVPAGAGVNAADGPVVWLLADRQAGTLRAHPVQVVAQSSDRLLLRGVPDGAWMVSAGAHKLDAGMRVRPVARPLDAPLPFPGRQPGNGEVQP